MAKARDLVQAGRDPRDRDENKHPAKSAEGVIEEWLKRDQGETDRRAAVSAKCAL